MGEAAKSYWMETWIEQELTPAEPEQSDGDDLDLLCTGVSEVLWLYGSD